MKATDYIIEVLIKSGVTDIFGYPGGVVCHLIDSAIKYSDKIKVHTTYHEQGAAFAACGYAQASGRFGVAFATSGPGATNLVTGIANAYFDSIPVLFLTGQVDTYAAKGSLDVRQRGFQETDIVGMVKGVTKLSANIDSANKLPQYLQEALALAVSGRPGPVLLDLPADVQRADIPDDVIPTEQTMSLSPNIEQGDCSQAATTIIEALQHADRPCLLVGAGIRQNSLGKEFRRLAEGLNIPVVATMPACDILPSDHNLYYGFIGANGHRSANFILAKSDLIVTLGSRLDLKQVGNDRKKFAPNARIIRVDIDQKELEYKVHEDETQIIADLNTLVPALQDTLGSYTERHKDWLKVCDILKEQLAQYDFSIQHHLIREISNIIPENTFVTADCGQSELWVPLAYKLKESQQIYLTAGLGSMGYSLPASIGVHYATRRPVVSFNGDGGVQMNIQELQFIAQNQLPVTVIILNNASLGMIRQFQEINFAQNYALTTPQTGYCPPDFKKLAFAYGLPYHLIKDANDVNQITFLGKSSAGPAIVEVSLPAKTYLYPNFVGGNPPHDMQPLMDRALYKELTDL